MSTSEPGTMPPPSSLSTSVIPREDRSPEMQLMPLRASGLRRSETAVPELRDAFPFGAAGASTIVFHSPQAGQRPIHFALSLPQELQYQSVLVFDAIYL